MRNNPHYDASAEEVTDEPSDIGMFDMNVPNEPCYGNSFQGYGEGAAIRNGKKYISLDFALAAMKKVAPTNNIPTTLPRGR